MSCIRKAEIALTKKNKSNFNKRIVTPLDSKIYGIFKLYGEGLYGCNIGYDRSIVLWYNEDIEKELTQEQKDILKKKLDFYYVIAPPINSIKVLVLASPEKSGINFFNFSSLQHKNFSLFRITESYDQKAVIKHLFSIENEPYYLKNFVKKSYSSELLYDAFYLASVKMAKKKNPTPYDIEKYNIDVGRLIFSQ